MKTTAIISAIMCLVGAYILDTTEMPALGSTCIGVGIMILILTILKSDLPNQNK